MPCGDRQPVVQPTDGVAALPPAWKSNDVDVPGAIAALDDRLVADRVLPLREAVAFHVFVTVCPRATPR